MPNYVMIMVGASPAGDWEPYIDHLLQSGLFRGGSTLGNGMVLTKGSPQQTCEVNGFIRFEAANIHEVRQLIQGNPHSEAGGRIELLEEIPD